MILTALILGSVVQDAVIRHPFLNPIFTDHMVLQRGRPNTFWGWTEPGKKVKVTVGGHSGESTAGADGKWTVQVDPPKVGGPYTVVVAGPESRKLDDVLVGDVWICGGQSNMEFGIAGAVNGQAEVAAADHPQIRIAQIPVRMSFDRSDFTPTAWSVCSPKTVPNGGWNGFSAVGYFFGRELNAKLKIPIGLVQDCRGGSSAEGWISRSTLEKQGEFGTALSRIDESIRTHHAAHGKDIEAWVQRSDPGSKDDAWAQPEFDDHGWAKASLPGSYVDLGLGGHQGVMWFRTEVDLASVASQDGTLSMGAIYGSDWVWVNGHRIGATFDEATPRSYHVPSSLLKPGKNTIAVRVANLGVSDGFMSGAGLLNLRLGDGTTVSLSGNRWRMAQGPNLWSGQGEFPLGLEGLHGTPLIHYQAMIAPIAPLTVKGVIWYQGESNVGRSKQYVDLMQKVASDWRAIFQTQDLPFLEVQLANYLQRRPEPGDSSWAALREAQMTASRLIPGGGIATAVDVGEGGDVHPKNKQTVGIRLAKVALKQVYGQPGVVASGPVYRSFKKVGPALRIQFTELGGGLTVQGDGLNGFALAGSDHKFHWATAVIEGNEVVLTSPEVPDPVAARYAWADNPETTLYNKAGLPAFPFRTDNWPVY